MTGRVAALYRHPVKGFTPEAVGAARLEAGRWFPWDRLYAVEDGPSGFDPAAPAHIRKQRFTVLMTLPALAKARTKFHEASGVLDVEAEGRAALTADLGSSIGRDAFAAWLTDFLAGDVNGPLKVLAAPEGHRFTDNPKGYISILNLASVREIAEQIGRPVDPQRFRCNVHVEGWPAWAENGLVGRELSLGGARVRGFKTITRCLATHANPRTGERDMDVLATLLNRFRHTLCGLYVEVLDGGELTVGHRAELPA